MLRLVLLLFYLFAVSSISHEKQGGGADPLGVNPPPPPTADAGAGYDPDGVSVPPPAPPTSDAGAGYDPDGYK